MIGNGFVFKMPQKFVIYMCTGMPMRQDRFIIVSDVSILLIASGKVTTE